MDIRSWGDRRFGFIKFILVVDARNGDTYLQDSTYLVVLGEPNVVKGEATESYFRKSIAPGGYVPYRNKFVYKCLLGDLSARSRGSDSGTNMNHRLDSTLSPVEDEYSRNFSMLDDTTQATYTKSNRAKLIATPRALGMFEVVGRDSATMFPEVCNYGRC